MSSVVACVANFTSYRKDLVIWRSGELVIGFHDARSSASSIASSPVRQIASWSDDTISPRCTMTDSCLFCRILAGKLPAKKVYEDDRVFAFEDIRPQAPTHVLIIPRKHIVGLKEAMPEDADIIGYCHLIAARIARERRIEDGYRTVFNVGPRSGQSVFHLHLHLLGGRDLHWPPG
jgi:histidine triad (HIT) family protein